MRTKSHFGNALKAARRYRGVSQESFSIVSSRTYISALERGLKSPTLEKIEILAKEINIHPLTLITLAYSDLGRKNSTHQLIENVLNEIEQIIQSE